MTTRAEGTNLSQRVEPEITIKSTFDEKTNKASSPSLKTKKQEKKSTWFNWFVPLLLIGIGIGFLVFYPAPEKTATEPKLSMENPTNSQLIEAPFRAEDLSKELVSRYFNGTLEDKTEQQNALQKTFVILDSSDNPQAKKALDELKKSNLNAAKKLLVTLAGTQKSLQDAAKTWVNVGNVQNLSSSSQALQAYKKASEIDPENIDAYSRQAHVYKQLKQFDLAEKAYKRVQSFANQSTANKALTLANFGLLNVSKGKLVEAEDAFTESLSIYKKINNDTGIADMSFQLANLFKDSERFKQAESYYKVALTTFSKQDEFKKMAHIHAALGSLYQNMHQNIKAQNQFETALELNTNNNYDKNNQAIYQSLGDIAKENGETEKAEAYFAKASGSEQGAIANNGVADQLGKQAIANRKQGKFILAEEQHKQAITIYQQNKSIAGTISQQINLGFLYKVWGKQDLACLVWRDTLVISKRAKSNRASRVQQLLNSSCQ